MYRVKSWVPIVNISVAALHNGNRQSPFRDTSWHITVIIIIVVSTIEYNTTFIKYIVAISFCKRGVPLIYCIQYTFIQCFPVQTIARLTMPDAAATSTVLIIYTIQYYYNYLYISNNIRIPHGSYCVA